MNRLPTVRLGSLHEEDPTYQEIDVDFQPASGSKFGFAWPDALSLEAQKQSDLPPRSDPHPEWRSNNIASASDETDSTPTNDLSQEESPAPGPKSTAQDSNSHLVPPSLPRLSRAFSMPLPEQLGHWQHPSRTSSGAGSPGTPAIEGTPPTAEQHFQELSLELADTVQTAIQTLLQLSPPHLFDPAKEQFSACAVQIPTPSISALLTSMRNLNYISANMRRFGSPAEQSGSSGGSYMEPKHEVVAKDEFDIGELLQSVGDSLSGVAADADVDLVLHHGDAIKHVGVKGDECGISYALSHIIQQVIITTRPGDTIEIGLSITGQSFDGDTSDTPSTSNSSSTSSASADSPVLNADGPFVCTFDIAHKFVTSSVDAPSADGPIGEPPPEETGQEPQVSDAETRPEPQLETTILRRLLNHIGGTLRPSLQPRLFPKGRLCELTVTLERGPLLSELHHQSSLAEEELSRQPFPNVRLAREPSLEELIRFAETLRGKKVAFHASSQGSFAHHLTRYLTAWGMDISHVPTDGVEEKDPADDTPYAHTQAAYGSSASSPGVAIGLSTGENIPPLVDGGSNALVESKPVPNEAGLSFIIIDDDVSVLRRRLLQYRAEAVPTLHLHPRKRPSLAANHRPRSSPSIRNTLLAAGAHPQSSPFTAFTPVPIVHFTSLANYKLVKDAIQAVLLSPGLPSVLPEVIVIPKPAGPRRVLTALHTAVLKPVVDPFFSPIATSPMSPSGGISPFFTGRKSTSGTPPSASRGPAERPSRTNSDSVSMLPPTSPLSIPEGIEYFPEATVKKLGGNAASGLVIQSPDGRPAGIFFQPQSRTSSTRTDISATTMERERGVARPTAQRSRRSTARKASTGSQPEASVLADLRLGSPTPKPSLLLPVDKPSTPSPSSPRLERPRLSDQTELTRSFKGKGRVPTTSPELEESRTLSSAAWREATQNLAKQPPTSLTPVDAGATSALDITVTQSPTTEPASSSTARKTSFTGIQPTVSRSSTSPTSPEAKKSVARRATQTPKSPIVSTGMKKSKTMGNNIVPPISVLIVEDNAINQTILSTFMRRNKIKYEVAWNGREAVEKWRSGNFHLILMDIQMPVMDGIEATKEIRRLEKVENMTNFPPSPGERSIRSVETPDSRPSSAASTPFRSQVIIVALTASSLQSDRVAALAAGCNDFLTKPVTNSWLNDKIIEWGSIKALQMWAELRPEMAKNISVDQNAQAQAVANNLHVPPSSTRGTPFGSPLRGAHVPLSDAPESSQRTAIHARTRPKHERRSSDKDSSSSDSSPERWPLSSDDEATQDPITEPPAVIETPDRPTIELPEPEPNVVTGEEALLNFIEESKQDSRQGLLARPTLLGQRALSSVSTATSIASVMHDTPGIGGTSTDGLAAAGAAETAREAAAQNAFEKKGDSPDH